MVILIIGILAAIAIPAFLNQRKAANDATVKSDIKNIAVAAQSLPGDSSRLAKGSTLNNDASMETRLTYFTNNSLKSAVVLVSDGVWWTITGTSSKYCIIAYHKDGADYTRNTPLTYDSTAGGMGRTGEACNPADITDESGNLIPSGNVTDDPLFLDIDSPVAKAGWTNRIASYFSAPFGTVNTTTPVGNKAIEATTNSTTLPQGVIFFQPATQKALPVEKSGEKWTVSVYAKVPAGARMNMGVRVTDTYGGYARETGTDFIGTGQWQRVSSTTTLSSNDIGFYPSMQIKNHDLVSGAKMQFAGPMIERSPVMNPFRAD